MRCEGALCAGCIERAFIHKSGPRTLGSWRLARCVFRGVSRCWRCGAWGTRGHPLPLVGCRLWSAGNDWPVLRNQDIATTHTYNVCPTTEKTHDAFPRNPGSDITPSLQSRRNRRSASSEWSSKFSSSIKSLSCKSCFYNLSSFSL